MAVLFFRSMVIGLLVSTAFGCASAPTSQPDAEMRDPWVLMATAYRYETGKEVSRDTERAFGLYAQAARSGLADAQYQLGLMYELGIGVEADIDEAEYWYQRALGQGVCPGELKQPTMQ